jgi:predicted outer membrane protein
LAILLVAAATAVGRAQDEKPTAQQIAAIRACAEKNQDDVTEAWSAPVTVDRLQVGN